MIDIARISDPRLRTIAEKVLAGAPVDAEDARAMLGTVAVMDLAMIANHVREALHGRRAYYGVNMNLNYTNICELRCPLCAFSCDEGDAGAYLMPLELIEARVRDAVRGGIDEVHIVGGLNPSPDFAYYEEMIRRIKGVKPDLFVVAFTAVEYDYFARRSGLPLREVMKRLVAAGVDALPGGGAEIFAHEKRSVIAPRKIPAERWLEVMETAHSMGLRTNVTMLYNHIEDREDIVDHLSRVRTLQDRTGGFKTFVPLPYHDENTAVRARRAEPTGFDEVRIFATARIFLHNVPHLKALWMYLGDKMAQVLLDCGVDDFGATYHHERVVHAAGARTPDAGSEEHLVRLIRTPGGRPSAATPDIGTQPWRNDGENWLHQLSQLLSVLLSHVREGARFGYRGGPRLSQPSERGGEQRDAGDEPDLGRGVCRLPGADAHALGLLPELHRLRAVGDTEERVSHRGAGREAGGVSMASKTSENLLKILLKKFYGIEPQYVQVPPQPDLASVDAALIIGNEAMVETGVPVAYQYDLGDLWLRKTGHPVVFAVFVLQRDAVEKSRPILRSVLASYRRSLACLANGRGELIDAARRRYPDVPYDINAYYDCLRFEFTVEMKHALEYYFEQAAALGLLRPVKDIEFISF